MINLDFNKTPFGPRGALGAWQEAQNAFARAKAERHGQEILNAFNAQQNPQRVKELALSNAFNEENNPLKLEEARQQNEWRPQLNQSTLNSQAANTEATRLNNDLSRETNPFKAREAKRQAEFNAFADPYARQQAEINNQLYEKKQKAAIQALNNRGLYSGTNSGSKDEMQYARNVELDNPQLEGDPDAIREAGEVYIRSGDKLADGTPLNPISEATKRALKRAEKSATTALQFNQSMSGQKAEKELKIFTDYADRGIAPYATTYAGKSPTQIIDSLKSDPKSQKRLGRFIGAQGLLFEIANVQNRLAGGQPGITTISEMMKASGQHIDTSFPKLSAETRAEARRYMNEALEEGFAARESVGTSLSNPGNKKSGEKKQTKDRVYNPITKRLE